MCNFFVLNNDNESGNAKLKIILGATHGTEHGC